MRAPRKPKTIFTDCSPLEQISNAGERKFSNMNSRIQRSQPMNFQSCLLSTILWFALISLACDPQEAPEPPPTKLPHIPLKLTLPKGWVQDPSHLTKDPAKGGTILKLVRKSAVPGSPRIEFSLTPLSTETPKVSYLSRQVSKHSKELQKQNNLTPQSQREKQITFAGRPAIRLEQSYTLGSKPTDVAVTQFSIVTVIAERGLHITVAGRNELITPLKSEIESILTSAK